MQREIIFFLTQYAIFLRHEFVEAIVGRNVREAIEGVYPSVVAIVRFSDLPNDLRFDVSCSGTLITRDHVLSAEHCFTNMGPWGLYTLVGSIDLRRATRYYSAWWISHNQWANFENRDYTYDSNDIIINKLLEKVPETIVPALISQDDRTQLFGLNVETLGWGWLEDDVNPFTLHSAKVRIVANEDCENMLSRYYGEVLLISDRYICTVAEPPVHLSNGDSGGPVFYGSFLVGINHGTCPIQLDHTLLDRRKVNLHISIDFYRTFIEQTMCI